MEKLYHYAWKHRLFPLTMLQTTDGRAVDIVDGGMANSDAGPDFFNAKIRLDDELWVGNVELHIRSSQWTQHGHDHDKAYNNVILHVVTVADTEVYNELGQCLPQVVIPLPEYLTNDYTTLLHDDRYPRCHHYLPQIAPSSLQSWLATLYSERLTRKASDILSRLEACNGAWERVCFLTLARSFGFGINAAVFELWAQTIPLTILAHHRDDLFQLEALFFGQAGLLDPSVARPAYRSRLAEDDYFQSLAGEYRFLADKYGLTPIAGSQWRFLRLRPQSFPTLRLAQFAHLYYNNTAGMQQLVACTTVHDVREALSTTVSDYWKTHYLFGEPPSSPHDKTLSADSVRGVIINAIVPLLYAYGTFRSDTTLTARAFSLLALLPAEKNNIIRLWQECGVAVDSARASQALIQLKNEYCDRKDCLRCHIGHLVLRRHTDSSCPL